MVDHSAMRQRNVTAAAATGPDSARAPESSVTSTPTATPVAQKREHDHDHEHEEQDHDQPIDEEKLDNLLWEISKFCIPVGFILYLSIYLCYRHELYKWFTQSNISSIPSATPRTPSTASGTLAGARVDAPAPTAAGSAEAGEGDKYERWVKREEGKAWDAMAANIGPEAGAGDGVVVAATSKGEWEDEPDYHFTWTRDAALTISTFLPRFIPATYLRPWLNTSTSLEDELEFEPDYLVEPLVRAYVSAQAAIQGLQNPSGGLWDGGLDEPKFHVDGSAFIGEWGRPQRDGPALRALALIPYALFLLDRGYPGDIAYVRERLYDPSKLREVGKVIKNDLEEVGGGWWRPGFDLWEEVNGHHFFTLLVSLRALQAGANLATRLNDTGAAEFYAYQASQVSLRLLDFWDDEHHYYRATLYNDPHSAEEGTRIGGFARKERSGLDCAVPLAILHAGDEVGEWSAADDRLLSTLRRYVRSFEGMYAINQGMNWTEGWAVGRYREDVYNGIGISKGNPWFICTFAVAEMFHRARTTLAQQGHIAITDLTVRFWSDILGIIVSPGDMAEFMDLPLVLKRLGEVGDAFSRAGTRWVSEDGRMSEQIHRWDGSQVGARDLTWSYASFVSAIRARKL